MQTYPYRFEARSYLRSRLPDYHVTELQDGQVDRLAIRDAAISTAQIEDASITAAKIGTAEIGTAQIDDASITTAKIADLAVTDAKIDTLAVGKLTAGTLSAAVVLSGSIKTATSGARVEITSAGIEAFDAVGTKTVDINAADGSASFSGEIKASSITEDVETTTGLLKTAASGWRVELGDSTYPIRYWDGTNTRFTVDNAGTVTAYNLEATATSSDAGLLVTAGAAGGTILEWQDETLGRLGYISADGGMELSMDDDVDLGVHRVSEAYPAVALYAKVTTLGPAIGFGGGFGAQDVFIYRDGASILRLAEGDTFRWGGAGSANKNELNEGDFIQLVSRGSRPSAPAGTANARIYIVTGTPNELRVRFTNGVEKVLANDS